MDWGSSRALIRVSLVFVAVISSIVAIVWVAVGTEPESPARKAVREFTDRLDAKDVKGAAALTSYPSAAEAEIGKLLSGLEPGKADYELSRMIDLDATDAFFTLTVAWHFGPGRDWAYSVPGTVRKLTVGWRISWDSSVLLPHLGQGRAARQVKTYAPPPVVRDLAGGPLMTEQTLNVVELDPARAPDRTAAANAVAAAIAPVAPAITAPALLAQLDAAGGKPITAVTLRNDDFEVLNPSLVSIPGVVVHQNPKLISADRRIHSPVLDGLRAAWQQNRESTAGWAVRVFGTDGAVIGQLTGFQGPQGPDIAATLDPRLQMAAEDAAVSSVSAAEIVAIRPSTGAVLAVAQNDPADDQGPVALTGLYPAGDLVNMFGGAVNAPTRHDMLGPRVANLLNRLGIGIDAKVPFLKTDTGRVRTTGRIEWIVRIPGQEALRVSPFGMALAAATIARGTTPVPMIALGQPRVKSLGQQPLRPEEVDRMRAQMAASTANPMYAEDLRSCPGLTGYTGYAGEDQWFLANRGDVALAIHIANTTDEGMNAAARMAGRLCRAFDAPIAP
ncbi:MAG: penicillin-binding protein [Mycobacteriaceae bacterium]|nr:penicillin-binding protein [Mycobacteriaceae bacterium]